MVSISENRENNNEFTSNPLKQNDYKTYGALQLIEGEYRRVYVDNENKNFVFINGKRVYLDEYNIFQMKQKAMEDMKAKQDELLASFRESKEEREAEKDKYLAKQQAASKAYDIFNEAKHKAMKGYQETLAKAGCNSFTQLKDYVKINGGNLLELAKGYLSDKSSARAGEIRAMSDTAFYGWMAADAAGFANDAAQMEIIAKSALPSIFMD